MYALYFTKNGSEMIAYTTYSVFKEIMSSGSGYIELNQAEAILSSQQIQTWPFNVEIIRCLERNVLTYCTGK